MKSRLSVIVGFALLLAAPFAASATSYLPGQTLNPSCTPTDPTCIVVPNTTSSSFTATSSSATSTFAGSVTVSGNVAIGGLSGILRAVAGVITNTLVNLSSDVTGVLSIINGGTGISSAPSYGQVLVGNGSGGYTLTSTSSLGVAASGAVWGSIVGSIASQADLQSALGAKLGLAAWYATTTDALAQGSTNKYFANSLAQAAISVSGSPLTYTSGVIGINQASASQNGYLASTDWSNFNGKLASSSLSASYPLAYNSSTGVFSLGFGTTTANTFSSLQTFKGGASTSALTLGTGAGILQTNAAGVVSAGTVSLTSQVAGTLAQSNGGTGFNSYTAGAILYADGSGNLQELPAGSNGQVLKVAAGLPGWGVDLTSGGGGSNDGIFATTSSGVVYQLNTSNPVVIGSNSTSTANSIFEVSGQQYISTKLGIATTTPSTNLSVAGSGYFTGGLGIGTLNTAPGSLVVTGNTTLGSATSTNFFSTVANFTSAIATTFNASLANIAGLSVTNSTTTNATTTNLYAQSASIGSLGLSSALGIGSGGTGLASGPAYGQVLLGNGSGGYTLTSTSSLGITSGVWGNITGTLANQTDLQSALNLKLSSSSLSATYPLSYNNSSGIFSIGFGTTTSNSWAGTQTFNNISATNATTSNFGITGITNGVLATNGNGSVIATTSIGANYINGILGTINGTNFSRGGSITLGGASTTLLSDANTFSGSNIFSALSTFTTGILSNASSTFTSILNVNTVNLSNALGIGSGGTGLASAPTYGQLLLGNGSGGYTLTSTSSLGIANGFQWATNGSAISYSTGNVGIGTSSPGAALSVSGNTALAGTLSIQTSGTSTLTDLQGTSQYVFGSWAPRLWELADGTSLNPVTTTGATFKISRTEAVASSTCNNNNVDNECNAALLVESNANAIAASSSQQTDAIFAGAKGQPIGTDVVGLSAIGDVVGAGTGIGTGAYLEGRRDTATGLAKGLEVRVTNITSKAGTYYNAGESDTEGIWVTGNSSNGLPIGAGMSFGAINGSEFLTGIGFTTNSVASSTIRDDSSASTSIQINGNHTNAINIASNGTYALTTGANSGNVGIGTASPGYELTVSTTSGTQAYFGSTGSHNGGIIIDNAAGGFQSVINLLNAGTQIFQIGKQTDNSFFMYDASNTRNFLTYSPTSQNLILNSAAVGNVGIGTTTPGSLLSVGGVANFSTATSTFYSSGGINLTNGCFALNGTCITGGGGSNYWTSSAGTLYNNTGASIGINNASPSYPLDVGGFINTSALTGGFKQGGTTLLYASTTNLSTFVGFNAGANVLTIATSSSLTSGAYNTVLGYQALQNATSSQNVAIGYQALQGNSSSGDSSGNQNVGVGYQSLRYNAGGSDNSALGYIALLNNTSGTLNTALGYQALTGNTGGSNNLAIGPFALDGNQTGVSNVAVGRNAMLNELNGSSNVAVGMGAGDGVASNSFSNNVLLGYYSGFGLSTGGNNILLGYQAASTTATGGNNIALGYNIDLPSANGSNQLDIGNLIYGTGINGTLNTVSTGNIGIGESAPLAKLDIANSSATSSLLLRGGNNQTSSTTNQIVFSYAGTANYESALKTRSNSAGNSGNDIDFYLWNTTDGAASIANNPAFTIDGAGGIAVGQGYAGAGGITPPANGAIIQGNVGIGTTSPSSALSLNGNALFGGNLNVIGNITGNYPFSQYGTGAVAEPIITTVGRVIYADQYGTHHDGITDDTTAIQNALNAASSEGGGTVFIGPYRYLINSANLTIPSQVTLSGEAWPGVPSAGNFGTKPYTLVLNPTYTIIGSDNAGLQDLLILKSGMTSPTSTRSSMNLVASYAGTAITGAGNDFSVQNVTVGGFNTCFYSSGYARMVLNQFFGDCTNGLVADNVHDIGKLHNIEFWSFLSVGFGGAYVVAYPVSNVSNSSGNYDVTIPTNVFQTGDTVWVSGVGGAVGANGKWIATVAGPNDLILQNSAVSPSVVGTTTASSYEVSVATTTALYAGEGVSGTGIPSGDTVAQVSSPASVIWLTQAATASGTNVTLSFTNGTYTSGGNVYIDTTIRNGTAYTITHSEGLECNDCSDIGHQIGFYLGAGASGINIINGVSDYDGNLQDPTAINLEVTSTSTASDWNGGWMDSKNTSIYNANASGPATTVSGVNISTESGGTTADVESGRLIISNSQQWNASDILVGSGTGSLTMNGDDMVHTTMLPANSATLAELSIDGSTQLKSNSVDQGLASFSSPLNGNTGAGTGALTLYLGTTTTGFETAFGNNALQNATSSSDDVAVGYGALTGSATISSVGSNTAIGWNTLNLNTSGHGNAALGAGALYRNTSGSFNIGIGNSALAFNTTGSSNVGIGASALWFNTGSQNTAIGYQAGEGVNGSSSGGSNTFFGYNTGFGDTTGASNLYIGNNVASTSATGSFNVALGYDIALPSVNGSNQLDIGNLLFGTNLTQGTTVSTGNFGIGTSSPGSIFSVGGVGNWTTGTSTMYSSGGINLSGGCFAVNGTCITTSSGGGGSSASTTLLTDNDTFSGAEFFTKPINTSGTTGGYDIDGNLILQASSTLASTLVGQNAGSSLTTSFGNVALGYGALQYATSSPDNVAIGYNALNAFTFAIPANPGAVGDMTAVGYNALASSTNGYINTAIGYESMYESTSTVENTCVGWTSCGDLQNQFLSTAGSYNVGVGAGALWHDTTGDNNVSVGSDNMRNTVGAQGDVAVGEGSIRNGVPNADIGIGVYALRGQGWYDGNAATSTEADDIAIGTYAMSTTSLTTAQYDTAVGHYSSQNLINGNYNVAFGAFTLQNATSSNNNVAIGYNALLGSSTVSSVGNNTAIGYNSLENDASGASNTALGYSSLASNTSGGNNVGLGYGALTANLAGNNNVAIGLNSLANDNTSGSTGIGASSLLYSTGAGNTAVGFLAGQGVNGSSSGTFNSLFGYQSGFGLTTGAANILLGTNAASTTASGSFNIALGYDVALPSQNGSNQLDIGNLIYGTGINGQGSNVSTGNIGIGTTTSYSRLEVWGPDFSASTTAFLVSNAASTTEFAVLDNGNATLAGNLIQNSDQRLKTNITDLDGSSSLAEINALNPVTFNWIDPAKSSVPQFGFIAQQVEGVFPNLVSTTSPTALTPDGTLSLNYIDLVSPIVAAIQELSREIASIENTVSGFATIFHTNELCVGSTCVTPAQFEAMVAAANQTNQSGESSQSSSSSDNSSNATDTPPVIEINGANPATIQVGATYNDLGATIIGPSADTNLDITTYLNGIALSPITIDTSAAATDTIDYVVTDQNGLTSTSTRTVIIQSLNTIDASTSVADDATSTSDTSSTNQ